MNNNFEPKPKLSRREFLGATIGALAAACGTSPEQKKSRPKEQKKPASQEAPKFRVRPELVGSPESLDRQNLIALAQNLTAIKDKKELEAFVNDRLMVSLPENDIFEIAPNLGKEDRDYCRAWTATFLNLLSHEWSKKFPKKKLPISSSVRPRSLGKVNRNASPRSTHPTGNTIDISWIHMTHEEDMWMQDYLANWEAQKFAVRIDLRNLKDTQKYWYEQLTRPRRMAMDSEQRRLGHVNLSLPKVEATRETKQKCFHFAVARVPPFFG